jgi:hypothetical protein
MVWLVNDGAHTVDFGRVFALGEKDDVMDTTSHKPLNQLAILTGHVLMHKQDIHLSRPF